MTRDSKTISKKDQNKKYKKKEENNIRKKKNDESDSDNNSSSESEKEMDVHEYRKFLNKIFPSKNLDKKIKDGENIKELLNNENESEEENKINNKTNNNPEKSSRRRKNVIYSDEEEESTGELWETASESEEEHIRKKSKNQKTNKNKKKVETESDSDMTLGSEDTDSDSEDIKHSKSGSNKVNIIFTIGAAGKEEDSDYDSEEDSDYVKSNEETEDEDESVSSTSSSYDDSEYDSEEEYVSKKKNKSTKKEIKSKDLATNSNEKKDTDALTKTGNLELLANLKDMYSKQIPNRESLQKFIDICEKDIKISKEKQDKKEKKHKAKNARIFKKIIKDKNTMNDFSFYEKLEIPDQKKIIKELREINKLTRIEKPYRMSLLESDIPTTFKGAAMKKINSLRYMEPGSGEFYKIKNWVDGFMRIPFNKIKSLPLSIEDGVEKCHDFMENAQKTLNDAVYGLNDAKMQIMQMLGQLLSNPKSIGTAIAIHGPPGTGKTSLVKDGISKILNRPFAFISLGGATDSCFLDGHSYTYEGSTWGKIVQILIDCQCMNPVIYFDELDKISDTPRGEEIAGILTHLTDTTQNSQFHDKYFTEIDFDISKCLFIFSYNDESKVNPILKDRMYRIQTKGYTQKQKTVIGNSYLLPRIREQVKFVDNDIIIPDSTIHYIIDNHCNKEDGVRNLKRCLEIIHTKLNLYRLMKPGSNLFEEDMSLKVEFPFTVTKDIVDKMIKKDKENFSALYTMYV